VASAASTRRHSTELELLSSTNHQDMDEDNDDNDVAMPHNIACISPDMPSCASGMSGNIFLFSFCSTFLLCTPISSNSATRKAHLQGSPVHLLCNLCYMFWPFQPPSGKVICSGLISCVFSLIQFDEYVKDLTKNRPLNYGKLAVKVSGTAYSVTKLQHIFIDV